MRRRSPRKATGALRAAVERVQPATLLARVQLAWPETVGPAIAACSQPVGEREGVIKVACASAVWAQELDLLQPEIVSQLNRRLGAGGEGGGSPVAGLRTVCDPTLFSA